MTSSEMKTVDVKKHDMKNTLNVSGKGSDAMMKSDQIRRKIHPRWIICLFVFLAFVMSASLTYAGGAPTMSIVAPVTSETINSIPYTVSGTCSGGTPPYTSVTIDDGLGGGPQPVTGTSSWTYSWSPPDGGPYTLTGACLDSAVKTGNATVTGITVSTCSDSDVASWTITTPTEGATISGTSYTITARVDNEGAPLTMGTVEFNLAGAGWSSAGVYNNGVDSFQIDWDTTVPGDGSWTIQVRGFDPDCGGTNLITSALRNVTINNSGPASTITSCSGCHDYPPADGARSGSTGAVYGSHSKHTAYSTSCDYCHSSLPVAYGHRNGKIELKSGNIGQTDTSDNGTYATKGSLFDQIKNPTTYTCSNVDCHYNNITPVWGTTGIACDNCHSLPPTQGAHAAHYAAKTTWTTGTTADCLVCHPNNSPAHSDVKDSTIQVNGSLGYAGGGGSCSAPGELGCHNNRPTPNWVGGDAACTDCHVAGGVNAADPTSGLHATTNLTDHDATLPGGTGSPCEKCHTAAPSGLSHFNTSLDTPTVWNTVNIPSGYVSGTDSCAPSASDCHSDGGTWNRRWDWAKVNDVGWNYTDDAAAATVCGNCHGSFATGWNIIVPTDHVNPSLVNDANVATADDPDTLATSKTNHGECSKCHGWGHANYNGTKHVNTFLEMNLTLGYNSAGGCATNCHSGQDLRMDPNSGWTDASVTGDGVACGDCHNGGVTPLSTTGAHDAHGAGSAQLIEGGTACVPCHGNNSGSGFSSTLAGTHGIGNTLEFTTNLTYNAARGVLTGTCSGTAGCHDASTNIQWDQTPTDCSQCHQNTADVNDWVGNNNTASMVSSAEFAGYGHGLAANGSKTCLDCHDLAVPHDTTATLSGANPYRLKDLDTGTGGLQFSCSFNNASCHPSGTNTDLGIDYQAIKTHSAAELIAAGYNPKYDGAAGGWGFAPDCVNCHDPHGDGVNISMIQKEMYDKAAFGVPAGPAPATPTEQTNLVFTDNTTGVDTSSPYTSYADNGGASGGDSICHECHEGVAGTSTTYAFVDDGVANTGAHTTMSGDCSSCHKHDTGFKPAGCSACHGGDDATIGNKNYWPTAGASYPKRGGKHSVHIQKLAAKLSITLDANISDADQKTLCTYCHGALATIGAGGHDDNLAPADIADVSGFLRIWDGTADATTPSAAFSNDANATCSGIDCHNNQTTAAGFNWRTGGTSTCVMCHTVGGTNTAATSHPSSGIHDAARISGTLHDDSFSYNNGGGTADCIYCHTTTPTTVSGSNGHMDGINDYSIGVNDVTAPRVNLAVAVGFTDAVVPTCAPTQANGCHIEQWKPTTKHTWTRIWHESAGNNNGTECQGCHGTFTQAWTTGVSPDHTANFDGQGDGAEVRLNHDHGAGTETEYNQCISCHVYNDALYGTLAWNPTAANKHGNGSIEMITGMGYATASNTCATNCHGVEVGSHAMTPDSGWTVANLAGPALTCNSCHSGYTTHIDADGAAGGYAPGDCAACHPDHTAESNVLARSGTNTANKIHVSTIYGRTTNASTADTGTAIPTMNNQYSSHDSYIMLGGNATLGGCDTKQTEAEWCWACHDAQSTKVTEWGTNTGGSYNYGKLFTDASTIPGTETSNWTTGYWRSAKGLNSTLTTNPFWYKRGKIRSTHSANYDATTATSDTGKPWKGTLTNTASGYSTTYNKNENLDTAANIRCSYCHDVHGTHDGGNDPGGKPYIRGTWLGNPYPEDGAPRWNMSTFTNQIGNGTATIAYGAVPRGSADPDNTGLSGVTQVGGFWIDQNSNDPTASITGATALEKADNSSGLCEQCHGANKNGTWTAAAIGALDQVTGEALWVSGGNGHANSVIGAAGVSTTAANIFNRTRRGNATVDGLSTSSAKDSVDMGLATQTGYGTSYRQSTDETSGYRWKPMVANSTETGTTVSRSYAYRGFAWNQTSYATSTRNFSIAPGTSILYVTNEPELTTETAHNSQPNYHTFTCSKCHNPHASRLPKLMITNCLDTNHNTWEDKNTFTQQQTGSPAIGTPWSGLRHSQWASAQNCHRLDSRATNNGTTTVGTGWNKATPWIEDATPNPASGSGKTSDLGTLITY